MLFVWPKSCTTFLLPAGGAATLMHKWSHALFSLLHNSPEIPHLNVFSGAAKSTPEMTRLQSWGCKLWQKLFTLWHNIYLICLFLNVNQMKDICCILYSRVLVIDDGRKLILLILDFFLTHTLWGKNNVTLIWWYACGRFEYSLRRSHLDQKL